MHHMIRVRDGPNIDSRLDFVWPQKGKLHFVMKCSFVRVCTPLVCREYFFFSMFVCTYPYSVMVIDIPECRCSKLLLQACKACKAACSLLRCFSFGWLVCWCVGGRAGQKKRKENDGMAGCRVFRLGRSMQLKIPGAKYIHIHT